MMIVANEYGQRVLVPADGKWLVSVDDMELAVEERNYTRAVYIADVLTLDDCEKMYVEDIHYDDNADKWEEIEEPKEVE